MGDFNTSLEQAALWLQQEQADVVLLQELPLPWAHERIETLMDTYPYQFVQRTDDFGYGNAVLSRHPLLIMENIRLAPGDRFVQQRVVLDADSRQFVIYNVHLEPALGDSPRFAPPVAYNPLVWLILSYDNSRRDQQFHELADLIRAESLPTLVGGDFNTSDQTSSYNTLAAVLRDSFREVGTGLGATWPNSTAIGAPSWLPPLLRIDYLWHTDSLITLQAQVGISYGSDHLPVIVDYALADTQ